MTQTTETCSAPALAVANWWADRAIGGAIGDTGDRSLNGHVTMAFAVMAGAQGVAAPADRRERFVAELARRVEKQLEERADRPHFAVTIGVDYGPDPILADAAEAAGVPTGAFPWKTVTWTHYTHVVASLGYGAPSALVWQAEDWERPACGAGKYGDEYEREPWKCSALRYHDGEHVFDAPDPLCASCERPASDSHHDMTDAWSARHHEFQG